MTDWKYVDIHLGLTYGMKDLVIVENDGQGNIIGPDEKADKIQDLTLALIALEGATMLLDRAFSTMAKHIDTDEKAKAKLYKEDSELHTLYIRPWMYKIGRTLYRMKYQEEGQQ